MSLDKQADVLRHRLIIEFGCVRRLAMIAQIDANHTIAFGKRLAMQSPVTLVAEQSVQHE